MPQPTTKFDYLLRQGDNNLILGQRLGEWCGHGPVLEQDIALTNIALDLIGQARSWLQYAAEIHDDWRDEDHLACFRDAWDYHNLLLLEQPNGDFAHTVARQFFYDAYHYLLQEQLLKSADDRIAAIAEKAIKEVRYHLRYSSEWVIRLGDGTEESHQRMQTAIDDLWMFTGEAFQTDELEKDVASKGLGPDPAVLKTGWEQKVSEILTEATLTIPESDWMQSGGKQGKHTEHLGFILADLQFVQRSYPGNVW